MWLSGMNLRPEGEREVVLAGYGCGMQAKPLSPEGNILWEHSPTCSTVGERMCMQSFWEPVGPVPREHTFCLQMHLSLITYGFLHKESLSFTRLLLGNWELLNSELAVGPKLKGCCGRCPKLGLGLTAQSNPRILKYMRRQEPYAR